MNKAWITGLTLAGVAGSAGAAFAGISSSDQVGSSVEAQGLPLETSTTEAAARTFTYQVGAAGTVTLTAANGMHHRRQRRRQAHSPSAPSARPLPTSKCGSPMRCSR